MYVYNADTYCDSCGEAIAKSLLKQGYKDDGDSDSFPQSASDDQETDSPDHCASYGNCLEPIDLGAYGLADDAELFGAESRRIGALLSESLTTEGGTYVYEKIREDDPTPYQLALHSLWVETFGDAIYAAALQAAKAAGREHGRSTGSWVIDGNTSDETIHTLLQGLEDGDPAVLDSLPADPLSGEWADDPTPASVLQEFSYTDDDPAIDDEILQAYEDGFYEAVRETVENDALARLGDPIDPATIDLDAAYAVDGWSEGIAWRIGEIRRDILVMHMIGDDQEFLYHPEDIRKLERGSYCLECGQVGCRCVTDEDEDEDEAEGY